MSTFFDSGEAARLKQHFELAARLAVEHADTVTVARIDCDTPTRFWSEVAGHFMYVIREFNASGDCFEPPAFVLGVENARPGDAFGCSPWNAFGKEVTLSNIEVSRTQCTGGQATSSPVSSND